GGRARLGFASDALMQAVDDLTGAAHRGLYSRDLFHHQTHAADWLRRQRKDAALGQPPRLPENPRQTVRVFEPGDTSVPVMWATHPTNHDREQNMKRHYLRSVLDERPPWVLFRDAVEVRAKVTRRFYRKVLDVPPHAVPAEPAHLHA